MDMNEGRALWEKAVAAGNKKAKAQLDKLDGLIQANF